MEGNRKTTVRVFCDPYKGRCFIHRPFNEKPAACFNALLS
jgi:hypothetical protein